MEFNRNETFPRQQGGRLSVSTAGVKEAAALLRTFRPTWNEAFEVIIAALRSDSLDRIPAALTMRGPVPLNSRTFLFGVAGSGKTEACVGWCAQAANVGIKSVILSPGSVMSGRAREWSRTVVFDDPWDPDEIARGGVMNIAVNLPQKFVIPPDEGPDILSLIGRVPDDWLLVVDDVNWGVTPSPEAVLGRLQERRGKTIITFQNIEYLFQVVGRGEKTFCKDDTVLMMRSISWRNDEFFTTIDAAQKLQSLEPGEGFIVQNHALGERFIAPYVEMTDDSPVPGGVARAAQALLDGFRESPPQTHTERLNLVSRALGHSHWQAMDGFIKNAVNRARSAWR